MLSGEIGLDLFTYAFFDGQIQAAGVDSGPTQVKIVRIDSNTGLTVVLPFRAKDWPTFQEQVAAVGPVAAIMPVAAGALRGIPSIEDLIAGGRGG